jgi:hypothetical protein
MRYLLWTLKGSLKPQVEMGTEVHFYISATWEAEIRRIKVQGSPSKKVSKILSQQINLVWWCMPVIPTTWEA